MLRRQERHNEGTLTALMSTESLVQQDGCDNHTHEGKPAHAYKESIASPFLLVTS